MNNPPPYLVDRLLPTNEIHLLAGSSGAGKTTWLLQTLHNEWQQGKDVLGYKSTPVPWVYISADRSLPSVLRRLNDIGIPQGGVDVVAAWDNSLGINGILDEIFRRQDVGLAVIEAFGSFVDPPAGAFQVKSYLQAVHKAMRSHNVTLIGVVESPKMKPYEKYENPRQRVSGVASWAHFTETIFLIEPRNPKSPRDPGRNLFVCPRNGPGIELTGGFDPNGRLSF